MQVATQISTNGTSLCKAYKYNNNNKETSKMKLELFKVPKCREMFQHMGLV